MNNTIWSDFIQGSGTLYYSRMLRFSDKFRRKYTEAFRVADGGRMLEIGCGPGALTQALVRWYPKAEVIGTDRDSNFIAFARERAPGLKFMEADATALPFPDNSFDMVISNTVQEHIEPSKFFGEQLRVLRPGGVCLALSARRGISSAPPCIARESEYEKRFWEKVNETAGGMDEQFGVARYAMSESELPAAMEKYGFREVSTDYLTINLTPDNPEYSPEEARAMINAHRQTSLDALESAMRSAPCAVSGDELAEMRRLINAKYDERIALYDAGDKQWETSLSLTMVLRGVK